MKKENLRGLSEVRVTKEELLEKVIENRTQHMATYREARDKYHREYLDEVISLELLARDEQIEEVQEKIFALVRMEEPRSHLEEYNRVVSLLKASQDEEFVLSAREFEQYWRDEWAWKEEFINSTSRYNR